MNRLARLLLACALPLTLTLAACGEEAEQNNTANGTTGERTNPFAGDAAAAIAGQTIFMTNCQGCHGPDGAPAALNGNKDLSVTAAEFSDDKIYKVIADGVPGTAMGAYKGSLSEDEIWQAVTHVRTFKK